MNIQEYLEENKNIQKNLLDYLDNDNNTEEEYQNLMEIFDIIKIHFDQYKIKSLFNLILNISNNHYRNPNFFSKIELILQLFKDDIPKYFSNSELFSIFKSNKRLLLFLIEEKLMTIDEDIAKKIIDKKKFIEAYYLNYFQPEIQPFVNKIIGTYENKICQLFQEEIPSNFYENRKIGENEDPICKMIRTDSIEDFITFVNKHEYSLNSSFNNSIYETNSILLQYKEITLIQYAAFFGSIQIFKYLIKNGAKLNTSLWSCSIHGNNPEIIHILEEKLQFRDLDWGSTAIKCHHNEIANYIIKNDFENRQIDFSCYTKLFLKYHNYLLIDSLNESHFFYFCKYDYHFLVNLLLTKDIDVNKREI